MVVTRKAMQISVLHFCAAATFNYCPLSSIAAPPLHVTSVFHLHGWKWTFKMPRAKHSKVWLYFTPKDANSATCNKCLKAILCKGDNTSDLIKRLMTHGIFIKAEKCIVFDSLWDPTPSTSAATSIPVEYSPSPASVVGITDYDDGSFSSSGE